MEILLSVSAIIILLAGIVIMVSQWKKKKSANLGIAFLSLGNALRMAGMYLKDHSLLNLIMFSLCLVAAVTMLTLEVAQK